MDSRHRNSVVAVVSYKTHDRQKAGTGMLVASNLVLTACHVVRHEEVCGVVRLRWSSDNPDFSANSGNMSNGYHNAIEENEGDRGVVWYDEDLDLALIKCNAPNDIVPVQLCREVHGSGQPWFAEAFPAICESSWKESVELSGSAGTCKGRDRQSRFTLAGLHQLKINRGNSPPHKEHVANNWSGVSGASVVIERGASFQIIGVIVTEYIGFETMLEAAPIYEALKDSTFKNRVHPNQFDHEKYVLEIKKCLVKLIDSPNGENLILDHLSNGLSDLRDPKNLDSIAQGLADCPLDDGLARLYSIFDRAADGESNSRTNTQECVYRLACAFTVVASGQQICTELRSDSQREFLEMVCDSAAGVEVGMASFDGRIAEFRERAEDGDLSSGKFSLEQQPEQGLRKVTSLLGKEVDRLTGRDIFDAVGVAVGTRAPKAFLKTEQIAFQKTAGYDRSPSYYLPYPVSDSTSREQARELSDQIDCPLLSIATYEPNLSASDEEEDIDELRFGLFRKMLPIKIEQ